MLNFENTDPRFLPYDRPSNKLIGFLRKHYSLGDYVVQNNNFVVFNEFFQNVKPRTERNTPKLNTGNNLSNVGQQLICTGHY